MDGQCIYFVPPLFNNTCELLADIPEPSLTSLDESMTGDLSQPPKESSFSDGEVLPRNSTTMATSTPQRRTYARRSVSLMDVSKIDEFAARPLGNILTSWETMGSQSSVGKSRDSGYVHSGSLMSVNSGKLSDVKMCPDQVSTILEECSRLKKELEYSEILINTLHETNNDLRNKCADAHNRISELRLKCSNHCDCSKQSGTALVEGMSSDSMFIANSASSSSISSRSSSPEIINELPAEISQPQIKTLPKEKFLSEDEFCFSDIASICGNNMAKNCQAKKGDNNVWNYNYQDYFEQGKSQKLYIEASGSTCEDNQITLVTKKDNSGQYSDCFKRPIEQYCQSRQNSSYVIRDNVGKSRYVSVEAKSEPEDKILPDEGKPIFVADERKGKIWVGSFKVWGDSSIRVAPKSTVLSQSFSSVEDYRPPMHYSSKSFNVLPDDCSDMNRSFQKGVDVKVCSTPLSVRPARPSSVSSSFPFRTDQSRLRYSSLSNSSSNKDCKTSVKQIPKVNDKSSKVSSRLNSINITISSKVDNHKGSKMLNPDACNSQTSLLHSDHYKHSLDPALGVGSFNNGTLKIDSTMGPSTPTSKQSKENPSNLGVSVSKSASGLCPDAILDKWNSLKKKLENISFSSGSSRILSNSSSFISVTDQSPSLLNNSKLLSRNSITNSNSNIVSPVLPRVNSSCGNESLSHVSTSSPQNIQECLEKANEYAKELSSGLSCLPSRLDYIQSIGRP